MSDRFSIDEAYGQDSAGTQPSTPTSAATFSIDEAYGRAPKPTAIGMPFRPGDLPTPAPSAPEQPGAYSQMMQTLDQWGITGVDPKTYRGRRADGSLRTAEDDAREYPNGPVASAPPPRSALGIFADRASDMFSEAGTGVNGWFKRGNSEADIDEGIAMAINAGILKTPEDIERARSENRARVARRIADTREQRAMRDAADPTWDPKQGWLPNVGRELAGFGGDIVGDANPTYLIGGEVVPVAKLAVPLAERFLPSAIARFAPAASRVVSMGTVNAGLDVGIQAGEINDGIQTEYDPYRTMMAFVTGGGLQTLGEVGAAGLRTLRARWKSRGVDVDSVPDDQLVTGSLDGTFGERMDPTDVATTLQGVGSSPDHFSTPERAEAAALRVQGRGNGVSGAGIGSRGAPILEDYRLPDVNLEPTGDTAVPALPGFAIDETPLPGARPRRARGGGGSIVDITASTESGGKRFNADGSVVTSPVGARGEMQVMPATARDPGYGIKPSDGTLDGDARVGREYLAAMQKHYGGDMEKVWAAYNAGPGALDAAMKAHGADWLAHMPDETRAYVAKNMAKLGGNPGAVIEPEGLPFEIDTARHAADTPQPGEDTRSASERVAEVLGDQTPAETAVRASPGDLEAMPVEKPAKAPDAIAVDPVVIHEPSSVLAPTEFEKAAKANIEAMAPETAPASVEPVKTEVARAPETAEAPPVAFTRRGDFYETVGPDAERVGKALDITVTRTADGQPMVGIPAHVAERWAPDLDAAGIRSNLPRSEGEVASPKGVETLEGTALRDPALPRAEPGVGEHAQFAQETPSPSGWEAVPASENPVPQQGTKKLGAHLTETAETLRREGRHELADLADTVSKLVGDLDVEHGPLRDGEVETGGRDVAGFVAKDADGNVKVRVTDADNAVVSVHEGLHAAVAQQHGTLRETVAKPNAPAAVRALNRVLIRARKVFDGKDAQVGHALHNLDELFTYGMTQPSVQEWLAKQTAGGGLWRKFVDAVRGMVGLPPKFANALEEVLHHGAKIIDGMKGKKADGKWATGADGAQQFAHSADDGPTGPKSWGVIGDLIFDPEFRSGDSAKASAAVRETFGNPKSALTRTTDRMKAFGEVTGYSADGALRSMAGRFNSPTIAKMADLFHAEAGKTGEAVGRTFDEAVTHQRGRFLGDLNKALKPFHDNKPSLERIRHLLAEPTRTDLRASVPERAAAATVRDLLKEIHDYRLDAGETLGEVKDGYFPRQMRADKVFASPESFLAQAEKTYRQAGLEGEEATKAATAWLQANIDGHLGIADGLDHFPGSAGTRSTKAREFGTYADTNMREFYETNPMVALTNYVAGAVKKAEENRRFGVPGRSEFGKGPGTKYGNANPTASDERKAWVAEHGAKTQWDVMRDQIRAELRANGAQSTGVVERVQALRDNNLGKVRSSSPKVTSAVSLVHAWNQLGTLGRAVFSSLPEIAMGFVRAGPRLGFTHMATTFGEVGRMIVRADPSDAARWADAVGAIGADHSLALLRARADDPAANVVGSKVLDQFYRKSGLEGWTRAGRTAAVKTGQKFIDVLVGDLNSPSARVSKRAAGYLRELGIKDPAAFAAQMEAGRPTVEGLRARDRGFEAEYATALLRFANQTVLLPSRAVKPGWARHPVGSLFFALQSYNYAFKKNVLDRVGRLSIAGIKERDITKLGPAAGLVMLTGITAMITGLRHQLYGGKGDQTHPQSDLDYALETIDRAGLFGALSPEFNAIKGLKYRRSVSETIQGSVFGRLAQGIDAVGSLVTTANSPNTNTAERKAAGAVYDLAVKPVENAVGASVLRGLLGSSVILGTGSRSDGALPSDKEWFTSALAGGEDAGGDPFSEKSDKGGK